MVLLAAACGDDPDPISLDLSDATSTTAAPTTSPDTSSTTTTLPDRSATHTREKTNPPRIELVSEGSEPRAPLRLALEPDDKQRVVVEIMQARQMHVEGLGAGEEAEASYAIDIDMTVTGVSGGTASVETTYVDFRLLNPGVATEEDIAEFQAVADSVTGLIFYSTIDDRGITRTIDSPHSFGTGSSPNDVAVAGQDVPEIPLPADPVGIGARWRTTIGPVMENGTMTTIRTEYELLEVHADRLVIHQSTTIATEPMSVEGWDYGASESTIGGTLTWYLSDLMPTGIIEGTGAFPFISPDYGPDRPGEIRVRNRTSVSTSR